MKIRERVVKIGAPTPLVGVLGQPKALDKTRPAVLLLNSGVMHHVGACRLSVKLARSLSEQGFLTLRFDFSGIGDSEPRSGSASFEELAPKECGEVMDYVTKKFGVDKFVLYGLCSGSDAAYETALKDQRVVGIAQIDAYCYTNWKYHLHHYLPRLFKWQHWKSFVARKLGLQNSAAELAPHEVAGVEEEYFEVPTYTRIFPPEEQVEQGIQQLMQRGVKVLTIFTGSEADYNYKNQFFDTFAKVIDQQHYDLEYYDKASHIVSEPECQGVICERISLWVERFP